MLDHTYAVIMAGGGGTRLWPVSRRSRPKQMIPLVETHTLFEATVRRLDGIFSPGDILVVTVQEQMEGLKVQAPDVPAENYLLEPAPRGTAAVVGLAAIALRHRDPQAVMAILPSDHYIRNRDLFHHLLHISVDVARAGYLVTLGIAPTYPSTAYGYIQHGDLLPDTFDYPVYRVKRFKEKPDESQARKLLASGDHFWNSGMFVWRVDTILAEIERQMPDLHTVLERIDAVWGSPQQAETLEAVWPGLVTETVDYGVMERAERLAVLPAGGLEWSDIGNWDSLFDVLLPDANGNIVFAGHHIPVDTRNSLVYGNQDGCLVVTIGVEDLIIVDTGDVLLVCRRDQAQKVRQIVADLKNSDRDHYT